MPPSAPAASVAPASYNGPLADATFKITIPGPKNSAFQRRPQYVSSATKSVKFVLNTTTAGLTPAQITTYNATSSFNHFDTGTLPNATCPASGADFVCTVPIKLPPGTDNVTVAAYDNTGGAGNVLSQQIATFTVLAGTANSFNIVLDANITTPSGQMTVSGSGFCQQGPVGNAYGSVGTSPITFTVSYTDAAGKTIPTGVVGQPKIQISDGTTYQSGSGSIGSGSAGVTFSVNQATQSFTITPNSSSSSQTINVKVIAPNSTGSSDGLTYPVNSTTTKSFTFSTGTAPPTHNFLAAVEQTGVGSGKVDFFNLTTDAGGPNGFATGGAVFSPASLAVTQSTNQPTQNDVDNPVSLAWDNNGDLLIGNGGSSGNGNLACVPVGAISTGANSSTTVTANIHDPVGLAYEPRNGTVAVNNSSNSAFSAPPLAQYVLTGNYTASTTAGTSNVHSVGGSIGFSVVNMPSLATGTFAATLTDLCEVDSAHRQSCSTGASEVVIFNNTGIATTISDPTNYHIDIPWGIAWENAFSHLIIANNSAWHPSVAFYTTSGTFVKTDGHDYFGASQNPYMIVANGAGQFAVAYTTAIAGDQVQIYTNVAGAGAPVKIFNPIPFDAQDNSSCSGGYVYGSSAIVSTMVWLSSTRLLVGVQSNLASAQGLYIYDTATSTTPSQWTFGNGASCQPVGTIPAQKWFQQFANKPFAAAFKP